MKSSKIQNVSPDEIRSQVHDFLSATRVLTLATSHENIPWSSTLAFAFDDNLNLYCITNKETRHVKEIITNPNISVAMHEHQSPTYNPKSVKGLQIEGKAEILTGKKVITGLKVFVGRFPKAEEMSVERLFELKTAHMVKITPDKFYFLDREKIGPRVEFAIE